MATTSYLDLTGYSGRSLLPEATITRIDSENPSFFAAVLVDESAYINSRLAKRYAAPFVLPYPEAVQRWLARIVDGLAVFKSGFVPNDASALKIDEREKEARAELLEAANAVDGLFDLPLRADTADSGITKGAPLGYAEASPFVGYDRQYNAARDEDANQTGSGDPIT